MMCILVLFCCASNLEVLLQLGHAVGVGHKALEHGLHGEIDVSAKCLSASEPVNGHFISRPSRFCQDQSHFSFHHEVQGHRGPHVVVRPPPAGKVWLEGVAWLGRGVLRGSVAPCAHSHQQHTTSLPHTSHDRVHVYRGEGLGKNRDGRNSFVKVSRKIDNAGVSCVAAAAQSSECGGWVLTWFSGSARRD